MKSKKENLTIITNLYPLPWEPNRATFNKQQFEQLDEVYKRNMLIPVAFRDWFRNRKSFKQTENIRYVPYFYIPKIGRRFYSIFLFLSILIHSGLWLKRKKNHILFASWAFPEAVVTSWLSKIYKTKFYFKVHGSDINLHGDIKPRAIQIVAASKQANAIISVSNALKEKMVSMGVNKSKVSVIYNGVNHQVFGAIEVTPTATPYVLFVGNLKKEKGIFELLDGFAEICHLYPNLELVYAGPGSNQGALLKQAELLNIADKVRLLGTVNHQDLPQLMVNAKLVALPSYNEGVPNVLLEAMACGTPVLASRVGGIPEVVDQKICGQLIEAKQSHEVARGLQLVLDKNWSRSDIKMHSSKFSWEKNKKSLLRMLETD
ncbi:MAG: glycosyltransferase involved in cell wall biosynthesis [Alteromonadaceae bacterium]